MSPHDLPTILSSLGKTHDRPTKKCGLCFDSLAQYNHPKNEFQFLIQLREQYTGDSKEGPHVRRKGATHCVDCQDVLEQALNQIVNEAKEVLVARSM